MYCFSFFFLPNITREPNHGTSIACIKIKLELQLKIKFIQVVICSNSEKREKNIPHFILHFDSSIIGFGASVTRLASDKRWLT